MANGGFGLDNGWIFDNNTFQKSFQGTSSGMKEQIQGNVNDPNAFKGDFYTMLGSLLSKSINDGMPNLNELKFNSQKGINQNYQGSRKALQEDFAGRGMGGSGAANVALAGLAGDRYSATSQSNLGYDQMNTSYKQNALSQLLGLNQFGGNQQLNANQQLLQLLGIQSSNEQFQQTLQFQKDSQPDEWASLLGSLLGTGGQIGAAALLASDKRVKENIKTVGTSKEGLPIVEFNYINDKNRYRGVIAQDVEKIIPSAVAEINGVKHVDYSQLSVNMEAV